MHIGRQKRLKLVSQKIDIWVINSDYEYQVRDRFL
jgi:hypothetical protein